MDTSKLSMSSFHGSCSNFQGLTSSSSKRLVEKHVKSYRTPTSFCEIYMFGLFSTRFNFFPLFGIFVDIFLGTFFWWLEKNSFRTVREEDLQNLP